MAVMRLN